MNETRQACEWDMSSTNKSYHTHTHTSHQDQQCKWWERDELLIRDIFQKRLTFKKLNNSSLSNVTQCLCKCREKTRPWTTKPTNEQLVPGNEWNNSSLSKVKRYSPQRRVTHTHNDTTDHSHTQIHAEIQTIRAHTHLHAPTSTFRTSQGWMCSHTHIPVASARPSIPPIDIGLPVTHAHLHTHTHTSKN